MQNLFRYLILFSFLSGFAHAAPVKRHQKEALARAAAAEAERKLADALECKYNLLTIEIMEKDLLTLIGQADQELDEASYGSARAQTLAGEIRRLANLLIRKTSTANKLGLEAFLFAKDISRS